MIIFFLMHLIERGIAIKMSFSYDVKTELCNDAVENAFEKKAEIYGLLLFGRSLTQASIVLQTEHDGVAKVAEQLLCELYNIIPLRKLSGRADGHDLITLSVENRTEALEVYHSLGYDDRTISLRINRANIENESDMPAFIRGAYLSCGTIENPGKNYHMEFVTPFLNLSRDLLFMLVEIGFEPKSVTRKGNYIVYFKESEQIEDLLTYMGAAHQSLELMNIKVYKDLRNKANRVTNCETANISKTVNASTMQVEAIKSLRRLKGLAALPEELREIAQLRIDNPDVSLRELGALMKPPLSRSGVNHRLRKITELAKKVKEKNKLKYT